MKSAPKSQPAPTLVIPEDGLCACGCGRATRIVAGKPLTYFNGTHHPNYRRKESTAAPPTLCACGCGRATSFVAGKRLKYFVACQPRKRHPEQHPRQPHVADDKQLTFFSEPIKAKKGPAHYVPTGPPPPPAARLESVSESTNGGRFAAIIQRLESNPDYIAESRCWLGSAHIKRRRDYVKRRRGEDPTYKLLCNLRGRINSALKGLGKSKRTMHLVGCSIAELRQHLEKQFTPGMSWENYGEWHVDHIVPCCSFDLSEAKDQLRCFHFSNLQPLWATDNFKKSGKHGHSHPDSLESEQGKPEYPRGEWVLAKEREIR